MNPLLPFSTVISKGYPGIVELSPEREGDPQNGDRTVRRFQGPETALYSLVPSVKAGKGKWRMADTGNPMAWILYVSLPDLQDGSNPDDPTQTNPLWFFDVEDLLIPLPNTPEWAAMGNDVLKDAMKTYLEDNKSTNRPGSLTGTALAIADVIKAGEESVRRHKIVLRRTMSISEENTARFMLNVDSKYTKAQLIAAVATLSPIPPTVIADMPSGDYLYKGSRKDGQPNGRFMITSEWAHAPVWATVYYPAAT